ncbi:MAG: Hsp70 family protein [Muribaculaceae bacterium]|nr:Hsp70 family protein [Muribaculaceae bacterium]
MEIQLSADKLFEISIADATTSKIIYEGEKIEDKITVSNKTDKKLTVTLIMDKIFVSFEKETNSTTTSVELGSREIKQISIYYTCPHNYNNGGKESVKITAKADYSLPIEKVVSVKFDRLKIPVPKFKFEFEDDGKYYIGTGRKKIGNLKIVAEDQNGDTKTRGYDSLNLSELSIIGEQNCLTFESTENIERLSIGQKDVCYDIYCEYNGDKQCVENFRFQLSDKKSKGYQLQIKKLKELTPKIEFSFISDPYSYYIGEGQAKIGKLTIKAEGSTANTKYRNLDLSILSLSVKDCPNLSCLSIGFEKNQKTELSLNEEQLYSVYCNYEGENKDKNIKFHFELGSHESKKYDLSIRKRKNPLENKKRFEPVEQLDFSTLKDTGIVGHLISDYTNNVDNRKYYTIENGVYKITDENYSFDKEGRVKEQSLEVGPKKYPIYINFNNVFEDKQNIDQDISLNIQELRYTDSRDTNVIDALLTLKHTPAKPEPHVYLTTNYSKEEQNIKSSDETLTFQQWEYDSNLIHHTQSYIISKLNFSNKQILPCGDNGIKWENIEINGDYIITEPRNNIEIKNGEKEIYSIPIKVDLTKITPDTREITFKIKCKEIVVDIDNISEKEISIDVNVKIPILERIVDDWYSIDLGTTGIVVAKWNRGNGISAIPLKEKINEDEKPIENEKNIVSSITILKPCGDDEENKCELVVAPSNQDLKQNAKYMLVPTKFMVGQDVLPFINEYKRTFPDGILLNGKEYSWDEIKPEDILNYTYRDIFSRISPEECGKVRKLIVTYPNTYSPNSLEWLKQLIIGRNNEEKIFKNLSERNLHFIPESDSVVAYYIDKSMRAGNGKPKENVVIYDMGAGTLDLSYLTINMDVVNGRRIKKSTIEKRIGIPIAGEYFSYLIFEQYRHIFKTFESNDRNAKKTIKEWVDDYKIGYDEKRTLGEVTANGETIEYDNEETENKTQEAEETKKKTQKIEGPITRFIEICTSEVFKQLLGENWKDKIDRIVFSGRGSQFKPIRDKMKEDCGNKIELDHTTISKNELKECVAKGAILYQQIFENTNMPFTIVHKNTYERIGMRYCVLDEDFNRKWKYVELMNETDLVWDTTIRKGAYHAQVNEKVTTNLDLRCEDNIVFYLTTLDEKDMLEIVNDSENTKNVFIKELFTFPPYIIGGDRERCTLYLSIDMNNKLSIRIDDVNLLDHTTLPNVEKDKYYGKCNWYFNEDESKKEATENN